MLLGGGLLPREYSFISVSFFHFLYIVRLLYNLLFAYILGVMKKGTLLLGLVKFWESPISLLCSSVNVEGPQILQKRD